MLFNLVSAVSSKYAIPTHRIDSKRIRIHSFPSVQTFLYKYVIEMLDRVHFLQFVCVCVFVSTFFVPIDQRNQMQFGKWLSFHSIPFRLLSPGRSSHHFREGAKIFWFTQTIVIKRQQMINIYYIREHNRHSEKKELLIILQVTFGYGKEPEVEN